MEIHALRVPQAAWAGSGDLARIERVRVRFSAFQLLFGRFRPGTIEVDGAHLVLVRDRDRRNNWVKPGEAGGGGSPLALKGLRIANSMILYRDAFQDRSFAAKISADPATGVTIKGSGKVRGEPVTLDAHGPAIEQACGQAVAVPGRHRRRRADHGGQRRGGWAARPQPYDSRRDGAGR